MNWISLLAIFSLILVTVHATEVYLNRTERARYYYGHVRPAPHHYQNRNHQKGSGYGSTPEACCCGVRHTKNQNPDQYGGDYSYQNEFTFVVSLHSAIAFLFEGYADSLHCGGTLLNERYVLTTATCALPYVDVPHLLLVNFGNHDLRQSIDGHCCSDHVAYGDVTVVSGIYIPNDFDEHTLDNNLALLELFGEIGFTKEIMPICLPPPHFPTADKEVLSLGWTNSGDYDYLSPELMSDKVSVVSNHECQKKYNEYYNTTITSNMMCAGPRYNEAKACHFDDGLPLLYHCSDHYTIVGVMSHGVKCGSPKKPLIYTKINPFLKVIKKVTGYMTCSTVCPATSTYSHDTGSESERYYGFFDDPAPINDQYENDGDVGYRPRKYHETQGYNRYMGPRVGRGSKTAE